MFDAIIDKPFIDFNLEQNKSKLLNMLKETAIAKSGSITHKIDMAYGQQNFKPCTQLFKLNTGDPNSQYKKIKKIYFELQETQENGDLISLYTSVLSSGVYSLYSFTILLIMKRYHAEFNVIDFLFCVIYFQNNVDQHSNFILNELKKSRINYILNDTYLPVVCAIHGDLHATNILILPRVENETTTWKCVHINTNGDNVSYKLREQIVNVAFEKYKKWIESGQNQEKCKHENIFCVSNIQKNYGTCGHWSLFMAFRLLQDFHDNKNIDIVGLFCDFLSNTTKNPEIIEKFNELIIDITVMYKCLIVDTVNSINNILGNTADEFPGIEKYARFLLHEGNHEHLQLNIEIMKSLSNLKQLRDDHDDQKYADHDVFRDDRNNSLTLVQTARRSKKQKMGKVLSEMNDYNKIMQQLDAISQKPLNDLTLEERINFEKDLGLLSMKLKNKTEFIEWLQYWYIQQNTEKRKLIREQKAGFWGKIGLSGEPQEPNYTTVDSQIERFLKFSSDLLQQKSTNQVG